MDKYLELINKLQSKISYYQNEIEIGKEVSKKCQDQGTLAYSEYITLDCEIDNLNQKRNRIIDFPKNIKKLKTDSIDAFISLTISIATLLLLFSKLNGILILKSILGFLGIDLLAALGIVSIYLQRKKELKKEISNLSLTDLNREIKVKENEKNNKLNEFSLSQKNIVQMDKNIKNWEQQIKDLQEKIVLLTNERNSIIERVLDNPFVANIFKEEITLHEEGKSAKVKTI